MIKQFYWISCVFKCNYLGFCLLHHFGSFFSHSISSLCLNRRRSSLHFWRRLKLSRMGKLWFIVLLYITSNCPSHVFGEFTNFRIHRNSQLSNLQYVNIDGKYKNTCYFILVLNPNRSVKHLWSKFGADISSYIHQLILLCHV